MSRLFVVFLLSVVIPSAHALTFYTESNPPMNFTANGKVSGWATDVVVEVAKRAGLAPEIVLGQWDDGYARARDQADTCIFSAVRRPERFKLFQWVGPLGRSRYSAFALEAFSQKLTRVDDLKAFRIGVVDDARAAYLRQRGFPNIVLSYSDETIPGRLTLDPARADGVDLWVTGAAGAKMVSGAQGVKAIKEVFPDILSQDYWLACSRELPRETVRAFSAALSEMRKDGTLRKMSEPPKPAN